VNIKKKIGAWAVVNGRTLACLLSIFEALGSIPNTLFKKKKVGSWWFMRIILATQEAEIRRITVRSQPEEIVLKTLSRKKPFTKKELVEWLKV
jgi:hypothetical protein